MLTQMNFYWWEEKGKICVQNMVAGIKGQYHEHTPEQFNKWKADTVRTFGEEQLHRIGERDDV